MGTAQEVLDVYQKLPPIERERVLNTLFEQDEKEWDEQIKADAKSGRLDDVFADDIKAFKAGKCRKL